MTSRALRALRNVPVVAAAALTHSAAMRWSPPDVSASPQARSAISAFVMLTVTSVSQKLSLSDERARRL
jgi:hypothetical protein